MIRSRKKVRAGNGIFTEEHSLVSRDEEWMHYEELPQESANQGVKENKWRLFKEAVMREEEDWWSGHRWKESIRVEKPLMLPPPERYKTPTTLPEIRDVGSKNQLRDVGSKNHLSFNSNPPLLIFYLQLPRKQRPNLNKAAASGE
ncbi:hypothetical protein QN277_012382 [Acacia crassicarpa]|uniref:Uncharacterized protein n=1 Tax=Acacia crassicarpa TaxID=499986 RepID=A0AAE1N127_9FABA|nr:hypothetical protein QN277_012382 [Acacia crassicarpa]